MSWDNVVWYGANDVDNEIFLHDGSTTVKVTDNVTNDSASQVSGDNIVWSRGVMSGTEIMLYSGSSATALTDNGYSDGLPQISGGNVVWVGQVGGSGSDWEIFLFKDSIVTTLTDNSFGDFDPQISGNNVVWEGHDGSDYEIFLYKDSTVTALTDNGYTDVDPQISGNNVVWEGHDGSDYEIFIYKDSTVTALTDNGYADVDPQISGNNVVWQGWDGTDYEIFHYNGSTVTTLTDNNFGDYSPQVSGDNVVWQSQVGDAGSDDEIFQAVPDIRPVTTMSKTPSAPGGDNGWFTTATTISFTRDEPGTTYFQVDSTDSAGWAATDSTTAPEGSYTFYYYTVDLAGNTDTIQNETIKVDTEDPTDPTISSPSHTTGVWSSTQTVDIDFSDATDTASGVEGFSISWSRDTTEVPAQSLNASATLSATTSPVLGDGTWYVNVSTKDYADRWTSTAHLGPFLIDTADPTINAFDIDSGATYAATTAVQLISDVTGADEMRFTETTAALAGASYIAYDTTRTFDLSPGDGSRTVWAQYKDVAGNESVVTSDTIVVDTDKPGTTLEATSTLDPVATWYPADTTVTLTRDEPGETYYRWNSDSTQTYTAPLSAPEGQNTIYFLSVDTAGNTEDPINSSVVKVDTTDPTDPGVTSSSHTTGTPSNDPTIDIDIDASATDTASGVDGYSTEWSQSPSTTPDTTKDIEEGAASTTSPALGDASDWYFHLSTVDTAGNWTSTVHLGPFVIDTSGPPTTTLSTLPGSPDGDNSWFVSDPTITLTRDDTGTTYWQWESTSALGWDESAPLVDTLNVSLQDPFVDADLDGWRTLHYYSVDEIDNAETVSTYRLNVDTETPSAPTLSGTAVGENQIDLSWVGATDADSGLDGYKVYDAGTGAELADTSLTSHSLTGLSADTTYSYYTQSYDVAGNTSTPSNIVEIALISGNTQAGSEVATVTVNPNPAVSIEFADIVSGGETTVTLSTDPVSGPPSGFKFRGYQLNISTNASYTPPIIISITYSDADVPGGESAEKNLKLLHYKNGQWNDVTISVDTVNNIITGQADSFSEYIVAEELGAGFPATGLNQSALLALALGLLGLGQAFLRRRIRSPI